MNTSSKLALVAALAIPLNILSACSSGSTPETDESNGQSSDIQNDDSNSINLESSENSQNTENTENTPVGTTNTDVAEKFAGDFALGCVTQGRYTDFITITADTLTQKTTIYKDDNCSEPSLQQVSIYSIEYSGDKTLTDFGDADHINQTFESLTIDGELVSQFGSKPVFYQVMLLEGIHLYLSDGRGSTSEERANSLLPYQYVRQ